MGLLRTLQPEWWFSAHLHVRFEAAVNHGDHSTGIPASSQNPDEIRLGDEEETPVPIPSQNPDEIALNDEVDASIAVLPAPMERKVTKFLALDKCLPRRRFLEVPDIPAIHPIIFTETLQVLDIPLAHATTDSHRSEEDRRRMPELTYDPEWLAITRAFHPYMSLSPEQVPFPTEAQARELVRNELAWVMENIETRAGEKPGSRSIHDCQQFVMTAPGPHGANNAKKNQSCMQTLLLLT